MGGGGEKEKKKAFAGRNAVEARPHPRPHMLLSLLRQSAKDKGRLK